MPHGILYAKSDHCRSGGPIDLDTVEGIDRAMDIAINARDRGMVNKLIELRREKIGTKRGRPGATAAGDLAAVNALLREDAKPRCGRPVASMARDLANIGAALASITGKLKARHSSRSVCWVCGAPAEMGDECEDCGD